MPLRRQTQVLLCLIINGCGGREATTEEVVGQYAVEGTCAVTTPKAEKIDGNPYYGSLQGAGRRYHGALMVSTTKGNGNVKVTDFEGCSFLASKASDEVNATASYCDPFPPNSSYALVKASAVEMLSFYLDLNERLLRSNVKTISQPSDYSLTGVSSDNYGVCEGLLDGGSLSNGVFALRYDGTVQHSVEQPVEIEQAALPGCTGLVAHDTCGGSLLLHFGKDRNELVIYEQGVGCTVTAKSQDGVVYRADGTECELNDTGIKRLGVQSRKFGTYAIDLSAKTWTYTSTVMQSHSGGTAMPYCLNATAQLVGDIPN